MKNFAMKSSFEKRLKEYYKNNNCIELRYSETLTSIWSIMKNKNILSIYYRQDGLRVQIKDNEEYKELYYDLLDKGYVYQKDTAKAESTKGRFQFYVSQANGIQVISEYVDYIIPLL